MNFNRNWSNCSEWMEIKWERADHMRRSEELIFFLNFLTVMSWPCLHSTLTVSEFEKKNIYIYIYTHTEAHHKHACNRAPNMSMSNMDTWGILPCLSFLGHCSITSKLHLHCWLTDTIHTIIWLLTHQLKSISPSLQTQHAHKTTWFIVSALHPKVKL